MKLLFVFIILMFSISSASAVDSGGKEIYGKQHSVGKLSADTKHDEMSRGTSKSGNHIRSTIKEDITKLKEEEDKEASEKRNREEKEGSVQDGRGSGSGDKPTSEPHNNTSTVKHNRKKTTKKDINILLCKFMKIMAQAKGSCKRNDQVKKAMIWPKKMLPVLEKMLSNKDSDSETENTPLSFADDGGGGGGLENNAMSKLNGHGFDDNWDSVGHNSDFVISHHKHRKRKTRRLLKMLRAMLNSRETGGNWDDDSTSDYGGLKKGSANRFLLKHLLNQILGRTDRTGVLREMLEEFFNSNGVNRNGEEAHEALDELMGRKNLFQLNNMLPAGSPMEPGQNLGFMPPIAQPPQSMGMFQGGEQSQATADGMIHAQMLSNGAIAPMSNPSDLQQPYRVGQPMNAQLPGPVQGRGLLTNSALPGMLQRPMAAANPRMYMGVNAAPAANQNVFQERLANEELHRVKAAEEMGIGENAGVEVLNDSPQRDTYVEPQSMQRTGYSDTDLETDRAFAPRSSFRSPQQASLISRVTRPEIEDSLNSQPTIRSTGRRLEGSQFYANHNGLTAALENDSLLRHIGAFRRGKVMQKGQNSISTKSQ